MFIISLIKTDIVSAADIPAGKELIASVMLITSAYLVVTVAPASGTRAIAYLQNQLCLHILLYILSLDLKVTFHEAITTVKDLARSTLFTYSQAP